MKANQAFFFAIIPFAVFGLIIPAYAETVQGKNYDDTLLGYDNRGNEIHQWVAQPERILDNGIWKDYVITQNASTITVQTANSGSFVFNRNTCTYNLYKNGLIGGTPEIKDIGYTVKGKANSSSTWLNVNAINNAACVGAVSTNGKNVTVTGTKTNGAGTFQIKLDYSPGLGIKETLRAYNNNPAWTNHNIGFTEKFEVPQVIKFGKNTYDLSQYNNTVLDRTWITNNKAKLIQLTDKVFYDFGIGWNNLQDIKITWQGGKAYLSLNYLYGNYIVPYQQWMEVDPTFGPSADTSYLLTTPTGASAGCPSGSVTKSTATGRAEKNAAADAGGGCNRAIAAFDITTIPANSWVIDSDATFTSSAIVDMAAQSCDSYRVMNNPATASGSTLWNDAADGSQYVSGNTNCRTASTYKLDLGMTADTDIGASRAAGNTTFSFSVKLTDETRDGGGHSVSFVNNAITLTVIYTTQSANAVTTLAISDIETDSLRLTWVAPSANGTIIGYMINYTSPWGDPLTKIVNDTATTGVIYDVSGLTLNTDYSFRVCAWVATGCNATNGKIANTTTLAFNQANFTIGSFNFDADNPLIFPIRYERQDLNSTHTFVNVTYDNTFTLACDLRYTYAGTNHTYTGMSSVPVSASEDEVSFRFVNTTNEITTFHCWNQAGNQSANYVLTQTDFLLLQQLEDFRNGTYGTMGQFGAFDLISLIVIIIAMIGLNFKSESVAGFFCIVAIAVLTFFEMIQWYTAIIAAVAVVTMLAIASTRKD
jgi:hypothetical protein